MYVVRRITSNPVKAKAARFWAASARSLALTVGLNSSATRQPPPAPAKQEHDNDNNKGKDEQAQRALVRGPETPSRASETFVVVMVSVHRLSAYQSIR